MGPLEELLEELLKLMDRQQSPSNFVTITPSDTESIDNRINTIIIGGTNGDLVIEGDNEEEVTIKVQNEEKLNISPRLVKTATTATPIIGAW